MWQQSKGTPQKSEINKCLYDFILRDEKNENILR